MKIFETTRDIAAPIDTVWRVLTKDMPRDPAPFGILRIDGAITLGSRIHLWSEVDPKRRFALKVVSFQPTREMVWRGGMPLGFFTGTRTFSLESMAQHTRFQMREVLEGPLSAVIAKSIPDLTPSFEKFSQALKERAETNE
ncbi:MAG: SRPBCC domain-containing protein [Rhodobacteraceae bacterium]|nr:SRPBCC domain-containing protein [Paracoccaceae bacterium]